MLTDISIDGDTLYQTHVLDNRMFRKQGQSLPGTLELPLELFLPPVQRHIPEDARDARIRFEFERLGSWVSLAEHHQRKSKEDTPVEHTKALSSLKRKVIRDAEMREVETRQLKIRRVGRMPDRRGNAGCWSCGNKDKVEVSEPVRQSAEKVQSTLLNGTEPRAQTSPSLVYDIISHVREMPLPAT